MFSPQLAPLWSLSQLQPGSHAQDPSHRGHEEAETQYSVGSAPGNHEHLLCMGQVPGSCRLRHLIISIPGTVIPFI